VSYSIKFKDGRVCELDSLRNADLRNADLRNADLRNADLRNADLKNADLRNADLKNADLCNADLCNADLCNADLCNADLCNADLCNADLCNADLRNADLSFCKGVLSFSGGMHFAFSYIYKDVKYIKIGCITRTAEDWGREFKAVGKKEDYNETKIKVYGSFIQFINTIPNEAY